MWILTQALDYLFSPIPILIAKNKDKVHYHQQKKMELREGILLAPGHTAS